MTHHLSILLCLPPHIKSPSITIYPPFTFFYLCPPTSPLIITVLLSVIFCVLNPFTYITQRPTPVTAVSLFSVSLSLFLFCLPFLLLL